MFKTACQSWNHLNSLSLWQILHPTLSHALTSCPRHSPNISMFLPAPPCRAVPALWVRHDSCLLIWHSAMEVRWCVSFLHIHPLFVLLGPYWCVSLNAEFRNKPELKGGWANTSAPLIAVATYSANKGPRLHCLCWRRGKQKSTGVKGIACLKIKREAKKGRPLKNLPYLLKCRERAWIFI